MLYTLIITLVLVVICVMMHYEALSFLRQAGDWMHRKRTWHRWHLILLVCILMIVHIVEVMLFGFAYFWMSGQEGLAIIGGSKADLGQSIYFSFVNYTTLGYGDLIPTGPFRFMAGIEALTGLVLITWTASFMYLQMQQTWNKD